MPSPVPIVALCILRSTFIITPIVPIDVLFTSPAVWLAGVIAILLAIALHEFAHAAVATALGDATARDDGRLTLNPLAHVDAFGFLMLLLVGFGWGKPVPFDPRQLRHPRWGAVAIALAGPASNLLGLVVSGLVLGAIDRSRALPPNNLLVLFLAFGFQFHLVLLLFNCIPIPPLDGSKLLLGLLDAPRFDVIRRALEVRGPTILLGLVVVDLLTGGAILGRGFHAVLAWAAGLF